MSSPYTYSIKPLGDSALLIDFGNAIDAGVNAFVLHIFSLMQQSKRPWITDLVPAYSSLAVFYDTVFLRKGLEGRTTAYDIASGWVIDAISEAKEAPPVKGRSLRVPVCYESTFAPDLPAVAQIAGLSTGEVVQLHTAVAYRVFMIGFLPGFAYMGEVEERIAAPRRSEPRKMIAKGSVGIAGRQTGIYPFDSPGGWQIIGRTPLNLFDSKNSNPTYFHPGDEVTFYTITEDEFQDLQARHI